MLSYARMESSRDFASFCLRATYRMLASLDNVISGSDPVFLPAMVGLPLACSIVLVDDARYIALPSGAAASSRACE